MKKTIISTGVLLITFATLSLQSCNSEKKEEAKADSAMEKTDTSMVDSAAVNSSSRMADTVGQDTGGRAGQAPPAVKK